MVKRITAKDRRLIAKIINRLGKGWKWREIAGEFGFPSPQAAHAWFNVRVVRIGDEYVAVDRLAERARRPAG